MNELYLHEQIHGYDPSWSVFKIKLYLSYGKQYFHGKFQGLVKRRLIREILERNRN